ncbi:MAG: NUDIX hydrolase [Actinomycetota bacterium]
MKSKTSEHLPDRAKAALPPPGYDANRYANFSVPCDIVILTMKDRAPHVLLVKRGGAPFAGWWALPGGFKDPRETLHQTAERELLEETNFKAPSYLKQFRAYGDPKRDLRGNIVTVAYLAIVPEVSDIRGGTDAVEADVFPVESVKNGSLKLAFDHEHIISEACEYVADQLDTSDIATSFVPSVFTLSQLRSVYESFWGSELDGANFRRNLLTEAGPYVTPTGYIITESTPTGGRPPELFKATKAWKDANPPVRRRRRNRK